MPELEIDPIPFIQPVNYADQLGEEYSKLVTDSHKKDLGQYFTPAAIASFIGSFIVTNKTVIKILDPGCGVGILSCAVIENIVHTNPKLKEIHLVAFETDLALLPYADKNFANLTNWLRNKEIGLSCLLCKNDFIIHNSQVFSSNGETDERYDVIVANPPYFKLAKKDPRVVAAKSIVYGQPNIYSIFMVLAARLLREDGQLVFITPRSFCSGSYFRVFREYFFSLIDLKAIHLFQSRRQAFKRDQVLQENVIIYATHRDSTLRARSDVEISTSQGIEDIAIRQTKMYSLHNLINLKSYQKILHLPINDLDNQVMAAFKKWDGSLNKYGIEVSTGPVVDFRSKKFIRARENEETVPLFYLHNVDPMTINWPLTTGVKGKKKPQYIISSNESKSRLVANKNYVLLRRFSTKDDHKRLIAAPFVCRSYVHYDNLGFENHLNYIYKKHGHFSLEEIYGLAGLLNSQLFDLYFRTFNGNTNVSATELRDFPLPRLDKIRQLGRLIYRKKNISEIQLDQKVNEIFEINLPINER